MKPSRELDAFIAEKVLGWKWYSRNTTWANGGTFLYNKEPLPCDVEVKSDLGNRLLDWDADLPNFSTDTNAAFELLSNLKDQTFEYEFQLKYYDGKWIAYFGDWGKGHYDIHYQGAAGTPAMAICLLIKDFYEA